MLRVFAIAFVVIPALAFGEPINVIQHHARSAPEPHTKKFSHTINITDFGCKPNSNINAATCLKAG
jgi:hypothetical protein